MRPTTDLRHGWLVASVVRAGEVTPPGPSAAQDYDDQMSKDDQMNEIGGPHPGDARPWRTAAVVAALAVTALVASACGGGSNASGGGTFAGGTYGQSLAYAKCMRSHGVPQFPAPDGQGNFNNAEVENLDDNDQPQARNANFACRSLLPNEGTGLSVTQLQTMLQQNLRNAVKAAHCMRAHGIGNFPDPAGSTQGSGVNWRQVVLAGLQLDTPSYKAAWDACQNEGGRIIPPSLAPGSG
jgi:hypothetical protein